MIVGLRVVEGVLEFLLPRGVRGEGMTRLPLALGVELDEALRQILGGCLGPVGGLGPLRAAQLIEPGVLGILPGPIYLLTRSSAVAGTYRQSLPA